MQPSLAASDVPIGESPAGALRTVDGLLRDQRGLITAAQCRELGMSAQSVFARVRAGKWRRLFRGVYVDSSTWSDVPGQQVATRCRGLLLVLPAGSVISHRTAAALWRLASVAGDTHEEIHVTVPRNAAPVRIAGCHAHTARGPMTADVVDGLPLTTIARTVLDIARTEDIAEAVVAADSAVAADPRLDLIDELLACCGWPGYRQAAFVVRFADGRAESVLESLARLLWHEARLPPPTVQAVVRAQGRFVARVDFLWSAARLVVEVDGMSKYAEPGELAREKQRQNAIVRAGYTVLRFTWADVVHRPQETATLVRAALEAVAA